MILTNIIQIDSQIVPGITYLFSQNCMVQCLKYILEMKILTDIISFVLLIYMGKNSHNMLMNLAVVVINQ